MPLPRPPLRWLVLLCLAALLGCSRGRAPSTVLERALDNPVTVLPTSEAPQPVTDSDDRSAIIEYVRQANEILLRHQAIDRQAETILADTSLSRDQAAERLRGLAEEEDGLYRELSALQPPGDLEPAHSPWLRALIRYDQAFNAAAGYYETAETGERTEANRYFTEGLDLLDEGYEALLAELEARGIAPSRIDSLVVLSRRPDHLASGQMAVGTPDATRALPTAAPAATATPIPLKVLDPIPTPLPAPPGALALAHDAALDIRVQRSDGSWAKGTGSVVSDDGLTFLTAFHVVGDLSTGSLFDDEVLVGPGGDFSLRARVAAMDTSLDLAVLRILADESAFDPVPKGDADGLELGDTVYTLSYPAASQGSLITTAGVILGRYRVRGFAVPLLGTDAEVSLGSSGGVVLNREGELVGIITSRNTSPDDLAAIGYPALPAITLFVPIEAAEVLLSAARTQ